MHSQPAAQAGAGKRPGLVLNTWFPAGRVASAGFILVAIGQALMILTLHQWHGYAGAMLPGWLILGTGLGFAMPTIVESATVDLPPGESGTGSAINATARQLGAVLATAVTVVILGNSAVTGAVSRFYTTWWVVVIAAAVGAVVVLGISPSPRTAAGPPGPGTSQPPDRALTSHLPCHFQFAPPLQGRHHQLCLTSPSCSLPVP